MRKATVVAMGNGFLVSGHAHPLREIDEESPEGGWIHDKDRVVEGKDPKKIGEAVLKVLEKPRGPRAKGAK